MAISARFWLQIVGDCEKNRGYSRLFTCYLIINWICRGGDAKSATPWTVSHTVIRITNLIHVRVVARNPLKVLLKSYYSSINLFHSTKFCELIYCLFLHWWSIYPRGKDSYFFIWYMDEKFQFINNNLNLSRKKNNSSQNFFIWKKLEPTWRERNLQFLL